MNKSKIVKEAQKVLQPENAKTISQSSKLIKTLVRGCISKVIDFDDSSSSSDEIANAFAISGMDRSEILREIDQGMLIELKKFINKINNIISVNKGVNLAQVIQNVKVKLQKCCQKVNEIIEELNQKQKWCLCGRKVCKSRYNPQITDRAIKTFVLTKINSDFGTHRIQNFQLSTESRTKFISIQNDEDCSIISMENISNNIHNLQEEKTEKDSLNQNESITEFLKNLKIIDSERKDCNLDGDWLPKLTKKHNEFKV